jgi:hypothetical protein
MYFISLLSILTIIHILLTHTSPTGSPVYFLKEYHFSSSFNSLPLPLFLSLIITADVWKFPLPFLYFSDVSCFFNV